MSRIAPLVTAALAALAACGSAPEAPAASPTAKASAAPARPAAGSATSAASATSRGGASAVSESSDLYEFDYSYPAEAGRIPALRAWLDDQREQAKARLVADATAGKAEAAAGGFTYNPYAAGRKWLKVAETPRFLSLSAELYEYTGGAHPNHGFDALLYDKQAGRRLAPLDLFASKAAFDAVIGERFCALLDKERARRRGEPVTRGQGAFSECIRPSEQTVILGSSNGRTFDRVGVLVGPYAAGSYAEGDYEVTLPVTAPLLQAVKPTYRGEFAVN